MKAKSRLLRCVVLAVSALVVLGVALFSACEDSGNTTEHDVSATVTGVTLSSSALNLVHGETGSLTATVTMSDDVEYSGEYIWSSSDENVVTVSGNSDTATVAAKGVGSATVRVEAGGMSASCSVTVVAGVANASLSADSIEFVMGEKEIDVLEATVTMSDGSEYEGEYEWSSSDEDVVTVSGEANEATVVASGLGSATVSVEAGGKRATCSVTVCIAVRGITLSSSSLDLVIGETDTGTLEATVTMSDESKYDGTYVWSSDDSDIAEVRGDGNTATVTAVEEGTATITVTAQDMSASCLVTVTEPEPDGPAGYLIYASNLDGGYTVEGVKEEYADSIDEVLIPDIYKRRPVTAIGERAFEGYTSVESVTIGDNVLSIGARAFSGCNSLTSVTIPENVETIGTYAFFNCTGLTKIEYDAVNVSSASDPFYYAGASGQYVEVLVGACAERLPDRLFYYSNVTNVAFETGSRCEAIGDYAFYNCMSLSDVSIPESVSAIGNDAFLGCGSLLSVDIPNSVTNLGQSAFESCSSMRDLTIGAGVSSMGERAFINCTSLESIIFNAVNMDDLSEENLAFSNAGRDGDGIAVTIGAGVERIPAYLFDSYSDSSYAPNIVSVTFADGCLCESIGERAFAYCTSLTSIEIPDCVKSIGEACFEGCIGLESMTLPFVGGSMDATEASRSTLFGYIFGTTRYDGGYSANQHYGNGTTSFVTYRIPTSLKEVTITGGQIFYGAFEECTKLTSITIPDVTTIEGMVFNDCQSLESVNIPKTVTSIGDEAFEYCVSLVNIDIPDGVTSMGVSAFAYCVSLTSIDIPDGVTSVGENIFEGCMSLTDVTMGSGLREISNCMFAFCTALEEITIPSNIAIIGYLAFYGCTALKSLTIPNSVSTIGSFCFLECTALESVVIDGRNLTFEGGTFYSCTSLKSVTLGNGLKEIGDSMFYGCTALESVVIPDGASRIGSYAFYGCTGLKSVTIGTGVKTIGTYAFYDCTGLTEINYNATAVSDLSSYNYVFYRAGYYASGITLTIGANVTRIPAYLFYSGSWSLVYPPKVTAIIFEEGSVCTTIGAWAFYPCTSLATLVLPSSVTLVDSYAFGTCFSIDTIYYGGTEEEWDGILIASSSDQSNLKWATKYWYSEDDPQDSSGKYWHYDDDGEIAVW